MEKLQSHLCEIIDLLEQENADTAEISKRISKFEMVRDVIPGEWWQDLPIQMVKNDIERRIDQENLMIAQI